jgi:ribosome maturation factor RimP
MTRKIDPELHERLEKLILSMGCELVGCEMASQGRQAVFRIYIEREAGVTVEDCSRVSRQVSAMMDVMDEDGPIQGKYVLEVSSPGIDRPLFVLEHYQRFIGSRVKIRLCAPINNCKQYTGILKQVSGNEIHMLVDGSGQELVLPFSAIDKANVLGIL